MSAEYDVLIAYKMNGEPLPYDHGYPVRCIVPGCIGGRSVKWLAKIEATTHVSQNPFQDADNKVFPPYVLNAEQATAENWWSNPDYSVYDLNINSVIAAPFHGTKIALGDLTQVVTLKGYAYGGSNRKVTRCEITLDDGKTWKMATIHHTMKEDADRYAAENFGTLINSKNSKNQSSASYKSTRYWTWVHWSLDIPVADLLGVKEICLKSWNDENNSQPRDPTWSLMGMLNNCWYRIRVHLIREPTLSLVFQHPTTLPGDKTLIGIDLPGWMEEDNEHKVQPTPKNKDINANDIQKTGLKTYTLEEAVKHTTEDDCWLIYDNFVYDCTSFLETHPGGASSILLATGADCTEEFDAIHSQKAKDMLQKYLIGHIQEAPNKEEVSTVALPVVAPLKSTIKTGPLVSNELATPYFNARAWKNLILQKKDYITPTMRKFTFKMPDDVPHNEILSLPTGMHVYIKLQEDINDQSPKPKMVIRAYTPSRVCNRIIEFVIKIYFPFNSVPGGKLTTSLDQIRIGEPVSFKGPVGEIEYHGNGDISIQNRHRHTRQIGMIAGGTGITPMWQLIQALERDKEEDRPLVSLIYCARSIDEIMFYDELNVLEQKYGPDQFRVRYLL
jgi:nitrate reductase (NAD(P)H)